VFQVVDIYNALAHPRPCKSALPRVRVGEILREEMDQCWHDPDLCRVLLSILRHRPGDLELLDTNPEELGLGMYRALVGSGAVTQCTFEPA
jgi:HD-GYP domain-containing protein (c-di-GMP phosphodiesterase class II)